MSTEDAYGTAHTGRAAHASGAVPWQLSLIARGEEDGGETGAQWRIYGELQTI